MFKNCNVFIYLDHPGCILLSTNLYYHHTFFISCEKNHDIFLIKCKSVINFRRVFIRFRTREEAVRILNAYGVEMDIEPANQSPSEKVAKPKSEPFICFDQCLLSHFKTHQCHTGTCRYFCTRQAPSPGKTCIL